MPAGGNSGKPEACVSRSRSVMARAAFTCRPSASFTHCAPRNSGRCFSTASVSASLPSSASIMMAVAVTGLVIDITSKIESAFMGDLSVRFK